MPLGVVGTDGFSVRQFRIDRHGNVRLSKSKYRLMKRRAVNLIISYRPDQKAGTIVDFTIQHTIDRMMGEANLTRGVLWITGIPVPIPFRAEGPPTNVCTLKYQPSAQRIEARALPKIGPTTAIAVAPWGWRRLIEFEHFGGFD